VGPAGCGVGVVDDPQGRHPLAALLPAAGQAGPVAVGTLGGGGLRPDPYYDYPRCRRALRRRGITPRIARRGVESGQRLGRHRYVVERSLTWLVGYRRLQVRYERRADVLLAFVYLACALVCHKRLHRPPGHAVPAPG
jgi:transposase